ncbi:MAG: DUF4174 domain-containing protein [Geminicoccaceae bacterium]
MTSAAADAGDLDGFRWHHRLFVITADSAQADGLAHLRARLDAVCDALLDRDLRVIEAIGSAPARLDGEASATLAVGSLRKRYGADDGGLQLTLIGKDGGVKKRMRHPAIDLASLFAQIDGMPMRRQEMASRAPRSCS